MTIDHDDGGSYSWLHDDDDVHVLYIYEMAMQMTMMMVVHQKLRYRHHVDAHDLRPY